MRVEPKSPRSTAGEKLGDTDRKMLPTLIRNASEELRLMREEIFGPVLPIIEYTKVDDAIEHVNRADVRWRSTGSAATAAIANG